MSGCDPHPPLPITPTSISSADLPSCSVSPLQIKTHLCSFNKQRGMERLLMVSTRRVRCLTSQLTNRVSGTRRCSQLWTVLASPSGLEISDQSRISTTSAASSRCSLTLLPHAAPSHSKQHRAVHATALVRRQQQQAQPRGRSALHTSFAFPPTHPAHGTSKERHWNKEEEFSHTPTLQSYSAAALAPALLDRIARSLVLR